MLTQKETIIFLILALAWLLAQEGVDAVIPGGKRKERIRENVQASEINLSKEELNIIQRDSKYQLSLYNVCFDLQQSGPDSVIRESC